MHKKNIKMLIRKQLKSEYGDFWHRLRRKQKKSIVKMVSEEVTGSYDFTQEVTAPPKELLGIEEQVMTDGIMPLGEMAEFIKACEARRIFKLHWSKRSSRHIADEELRFIDELLDNEIINKILAYEGYTPSMRSPGSSLATLFRAELLKAIKYPEISYRKFCSEQYIGLHNKENRVFIGFPLNKKQMIDHTKLSKFRTTLTFVQQINLLIYFLHHFNQSGLLGDAIIHGVDSTDLANDCKGPLAVVKVGKDKVCIYNDIDCDCGKRRKKRNKSDYFIGYRLHTLTAINAETGMSYPLVSLLAPANHHDSNFLIFLVKLAQAMGIDVKLISADEAYHDKDGKLFDDTGVIVTTPPSAKVNLPENVDLETGNVFLDGNCEIPMCHVGSNGLEHEYKCGAESGECFHSQGCPKYRTISFDKGLFQRIPHNTRQLDEAYDIRKNIERPFNLLKHQTGLEELRVRSQPATVTRVTFSTIATLLIKMAGFRRKKRKERSQPQLPEIAA